MNFELAWLGAKCKAKTLLVFEIFFTFFNTALSQSSIVAQYSMINMIKLSQQPGTKQQKIVFPPTIWIWRVIRSNLLWLIEFSLLYRYNWQNNADLMNLPLPSIQHNTKSPWICPCDHYSQNSTTEKHSSTFIFLFWMKQNSTYRESWFELKVYILLDLEGSFRFNGK